jgi:hypothetical protein
MQQGLKLRKYFRGQVGEWPILLPGNGQNTGFYTIYPRASGGLQRTPAVGHLASEVAGELYLQQIEKKIMGLSFSVKLHLYLTGNTLIHYGYFFNFPFLIAGRNLVTKTGLQGLKLRKYFRGQVGPHQINFGSPHNLLGAHLARITRQVFPVKYK